MNIGIAECMNDIFEQTVNYKFKLNNQADERKSVMLTGNAHSNAVKNRKSAVNKDQKSGGCC